MAALGTELAAIASAVGQMIVSLFTSVTSIFYTPGSGETAGSLTFMGYIAFFALFVGLVILIVNWVRGIIGRRMG